MENLAETTKKQMNVDDLTRLIRVLTATGASKKRLDVLRAELALATEKASN